MMLNVLYFRFVIELSQKTRRLLLIAEITYLSGVLGMEMVGAAYRSQYGVTLIYGLISSFEELLEMCGIVTMICALLDYLSVYIKGVQFTFNP